MLSSVKTVKLFKFIILVPYLCLSSAESSNGNSNDFIVVSTTPSPVLMDHIDSRLNKLEKALEVMNSERKMNQVLAILDAKVSRIEKTIQQLEEKLNNNTPNAKVLELINAERKTDQDLATLQEKLSNIDKIINNLENRLSVASNATSNKYSVTSLQSQNSLPRNCKEVQQIRSNTSGIYLIQPESSIDSFMATCDMKTKGGGWTVFLNRFDGSQDFYLNWSSYRNGFGNLGAEFWLGLEHLYQLTGKEVYELLVELTDWDSKTVYAHYSAFSVGSEDEGYSLKVLGEYSGDAGDSLSYQAGNKFSTKDKDQDGDSGSCATYHTGAWWYKNCMYSHLTGKYLKASVTDANQYKIMYWDGFRGSKYSLKKARMMVRPTVVGSG